MLASGTQCRTLMIGLDAAGKTTILYKMRVDENHEAVPIGGPRRPPIELAVEEVSCRNMNLTVCDLGGQTRIDALRRYNYLQGTDLVIFVVDSADRDRIEEAAKELHAVFQAEELPGAQLLVYANKQDIPNAMSGTEVANKLRLSELGKCRNWHVQPLVAVRGDGLFEGLDWAAGIMAKR
uniref:ADP-ribosylation factor n=1 Tax=Chromera velia CCMP2878 TaxID=1169474 RepID=A0A0G4GL88_9ALVE|eukprot:Cvel_4861.t1-p1 / transcript=Cvel_4861.t1 / gene=Cvel_4861 / organism=Chromera_velia_CCMP2878 / gene_product=ADP-ribosylation factor 2, putative / transcript_product=ADP-ribosylation factor 2, putative / location=Cvel_scaffold219:59071-59756(+) / protein_length=179 / sequence_SO=supercontig / SO=protein_coding / is_pseudo=false